MTTFRWFVGSLTAMLTCSAMFGHAAEPVIDFNRQIRPILSDNCFFCHGPDAEHREADLRLDMPQSALEDRGGYQAIVPGDADASELVARITTDDETLQMPPPDTGKRLNEQQIQLLADWVAQGAKWTQHWAYLAPAEQVVPDVGTDSWPANWIDHFLLAKIKARGLRPAAAADLSTLTRRVHFDLIGLPPDYDVVQEFVAAGADQHESAYERMVDSLLESEHFGERMAIYWLDLVRYADTVGYHGDQDHSAMPYRDYVIDALNRNLPFDQFTREQLAGDLLPEPTIDQTVATTYNRLLQTTHEGGLQPKEYLAIYAADRVRNVSAVWMGATLGCAQCHDHKYDPYSSADFYSMAAFFGDVDEAQHFKLGSNALPTKRPPEIAVHNRWQRDRLQAIKDRIEQISSQLPSATASLQETLEAELADLESEQRGLNMSKQLTMITVALAEPRVTRIFPRGDWLDESGPIVQPAVPKFLGTLDTGSQRASRLDLANWLTDPESGVGGLTARVFVNRMWYLFFGQGLAQGLDDFGGQGVPPDHPELLDQLAIDFVHSGWDVKRTVKQIVMSRAYRQASVAADTPQADPENRLFARQTPFRLPAEMVRDNMLAVSGLLVDEFGGVSAKPYQPEGYYRHLNFPQREYHHDTDSQQWRRGVYVHWQRQFLHPTLLAFDAPSREECTAQRARSNTPLAALALLNDPSYVEAARAFAGRILQQATIADTSERLDTAFQIALSRLPDDYERRQLGNLLTANQQYYASHPAAAQKLVSTGLAPVPEELDSVELAAWTSVARAILNLHESITRF